MAVPLTVHSIDSRDVPQARAWSKTAVAVIAASFLLRLVFSGLQELLPEEAYYWQFARHLDWSYLDHPGMVAWLIASGTSMFGHTEFGVRCGAILCSGLAAWYLWRLAQLFFHRQAALAAVMLFAALPYTFISGYLMTPDAPLVLFWTAALYYLAVALRTSSSSSWMAAGACLGLGMVSKYSIALLGAATIIFMIAHKPSRRQFASPWPYAAACLTALLFTPVIYWNATNGWASFAFQTSRRLEEPWEFGLPTLLVSVLCLITPTGMVAAAVALKSPAARSSSDDGDFHALFLRIFLGLPLLVFTIFSLTHIPKLNWTGPSFITALPFLGAAMCAAAPLNRWDSFVQKTWPATLAVLFAVYIGALAYFGPGIPGIGYTRGSQRYVGWTDLGRKLAVLLDSKKLPGGERPLIVGMDKHFLASEIGFYTPSASGKPPLAPTEIAGRNVFKMNSLMWELWHPSIAPGSTLLVVARSRDDLQKPELETFVTSLDPIVELKTETRGSTSGRFFYRWAYGYKADAAHAGKQSDN